MKIYLFSAFLFISSFSLSPLAQAKFTYEAILTDSGNAVIASTAHRIRLQIRSESAHLIVCCMKKFI